MLSQIKLFLRNKHILVLLVFLNLSIHVAGQWTWMKGDTVANSIGVYGSKGTANINNTPPGTYEATAEWRVGNILWLFAGMRSDYSYTDELWKYDITTNMWTWVKGTKTGSIAVVYGTKGVVNAGNTPGSRTYCSATWTDNSGNLWLFGGAVLGGGITNELWRYTIASNSWTWMSGTIIANDVGSYGTMGVESSTNMIPARYETDATWVDTNGDLWIYGGSDFSGNFRNDLWRYRISTGQWTWMKGSSSIKQAATYGTLNVAAVANNPSSRYCYSSWVDNTGRFWLFGGYVSTPSDNGPINDLWMYSTSTNMWTWKGGSKISGASDVFGTKCIGSNSNVPHAKAENRTHAVDACGNLWLFGGMNAPLIESNALWVYNTTTYQWIWVSGDQVTPVPVYGTKGVASSANKPNGSQGGTMWIDNTGYIWVFGGQKYPDKLNLLWRYNPCECSSICCSSVLPVDLSYFSIKCLNNIFLNWQTLSEVNSNYFSIERSEDGYNYKTIGRVEAAGSSTIPHDYTFIDDDILNFKLYYRLKQIDYDGASTTYYPVVVNCDLSGKYVKVEIYNYLGQVLLKTSDVDNINDVMREYPVGIYFLCFYDELGGFRTKKIFNR